jgi:hypothetical protein
MIRLKLQSKAGFLLLAVFVFGGMAVFGQTNVNRPLIIRQPMIIRSNSSTNTPGQELFNNLVSSAASFDMDSPVEAQAEFDPPVAQLGGHVVYRIVVTALDESLKVPDPMPAPEGLELRLGGRGQTYESMGGMKLRPQTTIIFHVTAASNGVFKIPAFEATAYGKPVNVPEAALSVVPAGTVAAREPPRLLLDLPEGNIYVGQSLRIPVLLPLPADGSVQTIYQARITGEFLFSEPAPGIRQERIRRNDQSVPAFVQEVTLTPLREGRQELVAQAQALTTRPVPGQTNVFQSVTVLIDSEPVSIDVKPLPKQGQLPGFTGAIGNFEIETPKLSTNEVRAGEPLTLTVVLRGDGNLGRLTPPQVPFTRDWQSFPPVGENLPASFIQQRGAASFSYTLIPLSDRINSTPAIPFCYFDPETKNYVDLTIPPAALIVKPGPAGAASQAQATDKSDPAADDPGRERELVLTGLSETPGATNGSLEPVQHRWWFLALQLAPAALLGGLWAWDRRRIFLEKHPDVRLKRQARRGLKRELRLARRAAAAQDAPGFVNRAANALREACAPHAAANPEALVCADVLQELQPPDQSGRYAEVVRRVFAAADAIRFGGPVRNGADLLALEPELERVLEQLKARL